MTEKSAKQEKRVEEPIVWRVFQRRGTVQILILLSSGESMRASEIDRALPFIARQVLGNRLSELAELDMIERVVAAGPPIVSNYKLTGKGLRLSRAALNLMGFAPADHIEPFHREDQAPATPGPSVSAWIEPGDHQFSRAIVALTTAEHSQVFNEEEKQTFRECREKLEEAKATRARALGVVRS